MTSGRSPPPDFALTAPETSTSSAARPRARTPARRTPRGAGSTATGPDCSSSSSVLSASFDPVGSLLRMSLASELEALTGCSLHWKGKATPSGRWWWVLDTSARRTSGIGSGLLPTATAGDAKGRQYQRDRGQRGLERPTPVGVVKGWVPTSRPCSGLRSRGVNQTELERALLPTPQAADANGRTERTRPDGRGGNLKGALLATPTSRDWRSGKASEATHAKNSRPLSEQSERLGLGGTAALVALVEWMMGYPAGWLGPPWPPTGTRSSRRSPKPSGARSSR